MALSDHIPEFHSTVSTGARQSRLSCQANEARTGFRRLFLPHPDYPPSLPCSWCDRRGQVEKLLTGPAFAKFVNVQLAVLCMGFLPPSISSKLIKLESNLFSPNYPWTQNGAIAGEHGHKPGCPKAPSKTDGAVALVTGVFHLPSGNLT